MEPKDLKYSKDHEWISEEGKAGVTDYAQKELGDVVFVELPGSGKEVKQDQEMAVLESVKAVSSVLSPVSGTIEKVNEELSKTPELINQSPYDKGWIAVIKISDKDELAGLMDLASYKKYTDELHPQH